MKKIGERVMECDLKNIPKDHLTRYYISSKYCINKIVADVGCGCGYGSFILSEKAKEVIGYDISSEAIAYAQKYYKKENIKYFENNFINNVKTKFDVIVCLETIEHLSKSIESSLNQLVKLLRKKGVIVLSFPEKEKKKSNIYHKHFNIKSNHIIRLLNNMNISMLEYVKQAEVESKKFYWTLIAGKKL